MDFAFGSTTFKFRVLVDETVFQWVKKQGALSHILSSRSSHSDREDSHDRDDTDPIPTQSPLYTSLSDVQLGLWSASRIKESAARSDTDYDFDSGFDEIIHQVDETLF
jgi:hypothetical protein